MKAVVYQDLIDENKRGYSIVEAPDDQEAVAISQQVIPGIQDLEPIHVTHLNSKHLLIIAKTNYELTISKRKSIIRGAISFYNVHSLVN